MLGKLRGWEVCDVQQVSKVIEKYRQKDADERWQEVNRFAEIKAIKQGMTADEAKKKYLQLCATIPADRREEVFAHQQYFREKSSRGIHQSMDTVQAEISAIRELDNVLKPPRAAQPKRNHSRGWDMGR